jgi:hypothetical protein
MYNFFLLINGNGGSKNCLALSRVPYLFTVNLIKNKEIRKPVSAKLFLLRVVTSYLLPLIE